MAEWRRLPVSGISVHKGLIGGPFGSSLGSKDYVSSGVPVIRGTNLASQGKFDGRDFVYVSEGKARGQLARNLALPGDVVFTQRGTLGQVGIVPALPFDAYVISQSQMRLRVDPEISLADFIYYQFRSPDMVAIIRNRAIATGVPHINLGILGAIEVSIPPIDEQRAIVAVLGALDDKIAINECLATTVRALGLAEYAQAVGAGEAFEMRLGALVSMLTRGVSPKYSADLDELTVLNQKCIRGGRVTLAPARKTLGMKVSTAKRLAPHDVLVNSTGVGTLGRVARWTSDEEATVDSHVTIVRLDPEKVDLMCGGFALLRAQPEIETMGVGSTGQTELRRAQLENLELLLPAVSRQPSLRARLDTLETRSEAALAESVTLAALRDTLLPRLMSGKLRVRDAERIVEDAV
ncbi:restriction endonuclease subunit S [Streptomyces microflavus]|uniref:restriction endonuclease subunit S n=1 Tax=Streptomyces microflavus TaxID=1919 RepID=UPI0037FB58AA